MESGFQTAIEWMLSIQQLGGDAGAAFFRFVTFFGDQEFYLLLFPLLFWCIDIRLGIRVAVAYLLSTTLNVSLKEFTNQPRPFEINPAVGLIEEYGQGMPSNHAQASTIIFGILAHHSKRAWAWSAAILITFLIGFSRFYLGVHFPLQIIVGWGLAAILLFVYINYLDVVEEWLMQRSLIQHFVMASVLAVVLCFAVPNGDIVASMAVLWAMWCGVALLYGLQIPFSVNGSLAKKVGRFVLGSIIVLALFAGLRAIFPDEGEPFYFVLRFVRYGLIGLFVSFIGPWLFTKIGLAGVS